MTRDNGPEDEAEDALALASDAELRIVDEQRSSNVTMAHLQFTEHFTPEKAAALVRAAEMQVKAAEMQYAVPAREQTKRSAHDTHRTIITAVAVVAGVGAMCLVPVAAWPIAAALAVLGGAEVVERVMKKRPPRV